MNSIYNSLSEIKIRCLLLLENSPIDYVSYDMITAIDFISIYGLEFGVSKTNLNGDNEFKYSELPSRREMVTNAINSLVREGKVKVSLLGGFRFAISDKGLAISTTLDSRYANEYRENVDMAFDKYGENSESTLLRMIQSKSKIKLREEE